MFLVLVIAAGLLMFGPVSGSSALTGDAYYEAPSNGYEGTYEWRGLMAYTYVYDWWLPGPDKQHVSSVYIHHPVSDNLRHMEIGIFKRYVEPPVVFVQANNNPYDLLDFYQYDVGIVYPGQTHKLLIRNMTMGVPDAYWERWIMSWNDVIKFDQLHPLTYGQAWESSEIKYIGDDNRAYWYESKRTSKPASWTYWTASRVRFNSDWFYDFNKVNETKWYNVLGSN